jgi:polyribonucleotide nucleotidyltransferase
MAEPIAVTGEVGTSRIQMTLETGQLAGLADGAVLAKLGRTSILMTAVAAKQVREGIDFFPLTVDIEERMYAAGKIPGSFFRREGRAGEQAILTARLIDRPLRPSFPDGFRNDVHVVGTVLGADQVNPYDVLAINAASAALAISGIPFGGPIGAVRLAYTTDGTWIGHPSYAEGDESTFEMVVAGRELDDGDVAIMMVEAGGTFGAGAKYAEGAPKVDETELAHGLDEAKRWIKEAIALQRRLIATAGVAPALAYEIQADYSDEIAAAVAEAGTASLGASQQIADKAAREDAERAARDGVLAAVLPRFADDSTAEKQIKAACRSLVKKLVRKRIVDDGVRIDGRGVADIRPLSAAVGVVPTAHGSGLFQRGETQVLNIATLGTKRMDQMIDGIDPVTRKRYIHHYNFPPFSTGEAGFMRGPKRREIGHGALAERALVPVVPEQDEFPYTIRVVSEVLASNGSTSMGSVCSSTLSLMDAGVPIKAPVAGIAMGLVHAEGKYTTLTDILGAEDAYGDMDFKVAGTAEYVTALQLDTKIDGIPADVLAAALQQAKDARMAILGVMAGAIAEPRPDVGETAPKIVSFEIPLDKIGEVIGPKGKVINSIQSETGADIMVDDDGVVGTVVISAVDRGSVAEAERQINLILDPPTAEVGAVYEGRVVNVTSFGAFVNILPGRDGLVHISKLGRGKRVDRVEDVVNLGDPITVRVEDIDPNGKVSLRPVWDGDGTETEAADSHRPARVSVVDADPTRVAVSFEDQFESSLAAEVGELGPVAVGGFATEADERPRDRDRGRDQGRRRGGRGRGNGGGRDRR